MDETHARSPLPLLTYSVTTLLVWGIFAFDRGFWQDEVLVFAKVIAQMGNPVHQLIGISTASPTRVLLAVPYTLAYWSGHPAVSLQVMYGITWLATGILAHLIVKALFPAEPWLPYSAGVLTLCATGDFLANSLVPISYNISNAFFLTALWWLIHWWRQGGYAWLAGSGVLLSLSIWMVDAAFAAVWLSPLLLWVANDLRFTRRLALTALFWYAVFAPYLVVLLSFLTDPHGYASVALLPLTFSEKIARTASMFLNNFTPWTWAFNRRNWFPALDPVIPAAVKCGITILGLIVIMRWYRKLGRTAPAVGEHLPRGRLRKHMLLIAYFAFLALGSNAIFASVQFADVFYRTQLLSGVWASMAIALSASAAGFIALRKPIVSLALIGVFAGLGIYGGLERQDYYLGYWRRHRGELRSIVEQVPGLRPGSNLLLFVPPGSPYLATEATYLAQSWMSLLYKDPSLASPRVFLWALDRNTECTAERSGFMCQGETDQPGPHFYPYDQIVLLVYSGDDNRYILQEKIPIQLISKGGADVHSYAPYRMIQRRALPAYAVQLLYGKELAGRLLPATKPSKAIVASSCFRVLPVAEGTKSGHGSLAGSVLGPNRFLLDMSHLDASILRVQIRHRDRGQTSADGDSEQYFLRFRRRDQASSQTNQALDFWLPADDRLHSLYRDMTTVVGWQGTIAEVTVMNREWPRRPPAFVSVAVRSKCLVPPPFDDYYRWNSAGIWLLPTHPLESPVDEAGIEGEVTGIDPLLSTSLGESPLEADDADALILQWRGLQGGEHKPTSVSGSFYFRGQDSGFDEAHSVKFNWWADGQPRQTRLELHNNRFWRGLIEEIRVDPVDFPQQLKAPFRFCLEAVRFVNSKTGEAIFP